MRGKWHFCGCDWRRLPVLDAAGVCCVGSEGNTRGPLLVCLCVGGLLAHPASAQKNITEIGPNTLLKSVLLRCSDFVVIMLWRANATGAMGVNNLFNHPPHLTCSHLQPLRLTMPF